VSEIRNEPIPENTTKPAKYCIDLFNFNVAVSVYKYLERGRLENNITKNIIKNFEKIVEVREMNCCYEIFGSVLNFYY
jgi:hypothetical protein